MGKTADLNRNQPFLVRVTGFEPAASCSQSRRATICATPGYLVFIRLGVFSQSSRVIAAAAPRHFAALRLLLRRGQPYQYNGLQGESQPAPAAVPPRGKAKSPARRPLWDTWQPSVLILFHPVSLRKNPMVFTNIMQNNNFVLTLRKFLSVLSFFGGFFLLLPVFRQRISAKTD